MSHVNGKGKHHLGKSTLTDAGSTSRFSHFPGLYHLDDTDGMVIVAGVGFRLKTSTSEHQMPGVTGAFVSTAVGERHTLTHFATTIVKPTSSKEKGTGFSYSPQNDSDSTSEVVGHVTVSEDRNGVETTLVQRKLKLPSDRLKLIKIYLKDHNDQSKYEIIVTKADTVKKLRNKLWREFSIPHNDPIVYHGKTLTDGNTLEYYRIEEKCTLNLLVNMVGG